MTNDCHHSIPGEDVSLKYLKLFYMMHQQKKGKEKLLHWFSKK